MYGQIAWSKLLQGLRPAEHGFRRVPLPHRETYPGGLRMLVEPMGPQHKQGIVKAFEDSMADGQGHSSEDFEDISEYLENVATFAMVDEANGRVFGGMFMRPSLLCRSQYPVLSMSNIAVHRDYRGGGHVKDWSLLQNIIASDMGFIGMCSRATMASPTLKLLQQRGFIITACLHREIRLKQEYAPNLAMYAMYTKHEGYMEAIQQMEHSRLYQPLPTLQVTDVPPPFLHKPLFVAARKMRLRDGTRVNYGCASPSAVWQVEQLIRDLAARGEYFAWDEFTEEGYFNRRFLKTTHVLTAMTSHGQLAGAALIGPRPGRYKTAVNATMYVFVAPEFRLKGIGGFLLDFAKDTIVEQGYLAIATDVFPDCHIGRALLCRRGFVPCGSLMYSACVKGTGFTDSMLFYKDLESDG